MKCPICGEAELAHDTRDVLYRQKDRATLVQAVTGDFCPACGESILDTTESDRVMQELSGQEGPTAGDADLTR
jgi:HTH-type transcriptional regulator/antitoxin MqsA